MESIGNLKLNNIENESDAYKLHKSSSIIVKIEDYIKELTSFSSIELL